MITAVALTIVAYALPAHAERAGDGPPAVASLSGGSARPQAPPVDVSVPTAHAFFDGLRPMGVRFAVTGDEPMYVAVDVIRTRDDVRVAHLDQGLVFPGATHSATWDGRTNGSIQPEGRYAFRVTASRDGATPAFSQDAPVVFRRHHSPLRGRHAYGDAGARFGAGRGGGGHQGQDVFADCGTPIVAARGGVVQHRAFHGRAGNYLVIDGAGTDVDYVYAHLREPARFGNGRRVHTGELIGFVGRTGDATACHLHFEMWSGPGWYAGGAPFDPRPWLRRWDRG